MIPLVRRTRKHVRDAASQNRSDNAEHDRPEDRHMHMHHRLRNNPRDQPNQNVPDQVKHASSRVCVQNIAEYSPYPQATCATISSPLREIGPFLISSATRLGTSF